MLSTYFRADLFLENQSMGGNILLLIRIVGYAILTGIDKLFPGPASGVISFFSAGTWKNGELFGGISGVQQILILLILFVFLCIYLLPYIVGVLYYSSIVEKKMEEVREYDRKQREAFTKKRNLLLSDITNAVKHNNSGTRIKITMKEMLGCWLIKVMDSGEKIDETLREHLFDPFVMGDESRNSRGGSGLGLSVSKKVIEMHGGKLWLEQPTEEMYTKAFCIRMKQSEKDSYEY